MIEGDYELILESYDDIGSVKSALKTDIIIISVQFGVHPCDATTE